MTLPAYAMNVTSFPEMYERFLVGPLFRPWAQLLLDRARPAAGDRVLDVACGTGIVARLARERVGDQGAVAGVDVSAPMLEVARTVAPGIDWREGHAAALPLRDGEQFDVVLCHQGLQFFPDRAAAISEIRRALRPGGRAAVAVWRSLEETPFIRDLQLVAERHVGRITDRRHGFGDATALRELFAAGGLADIHVEAATQTIRFADPAVFLRLNTMAVVGMSDAAKVLSPDQRSAAIEQIVQDSAAVATNYVVSNGLAFELGANIAVARRT
jgi:ubiquinone/menaquinone biosynthesis C-methylase UbiE